MNYTCIFKREGFQELSLTMNLPDITLSTLPKIIFQTYFQKDKIPNEVYENIKQFAPEYEHKVYDDSDSIQFLKTYFHESVLHTFLHLEKGPHKADLLRYCLMYVYGGIYMDIKTELISPLRDIFTDSYTYSVKAYTNDHIYQGVIASPPRNPMYLHLIRHMIQTGNPSNYHAFCMELMNYIEKESGPIQSGKQGQFYLFEERCSRKGEECYDGLDKWGLCCFIWDKDKPIIKTRRTSYPW